MLKVDGDSYAVEAAPASLHRRVQRADIIDSKQLSALCVRFINFVPYCFRCDYRSPFGHCIIPAVYLHKTRKFMLSEKYLFVWAFLCLGGNQSVETAVLGAS